VHTHMTSEYEPPWSCLHTNKELTLHTTCLALHLAAGALCVLMRMQATWHGHTCKAGMQLATSGVLDLCCNDGNLDVLGCPCSYTQSTRSSTGASCSQCAARRDSGTNQLLAD
jgi:hypothetical protein